MDSKLLKYSEYQALIPVDLNNISKFIFENVIKEMIKYAISNGTSILTSSGIVSEDTGVNYDTKISEFWGANSDGKILVNKSEKIITYTTPSANPRVDIIECRLNYIDQNAQSKQFIDPATGNISVQSTYTESGVDIEIQAVEGIESASPVAPSTTMGWTKIAEVFVDTAGGISNADIYNVNKYLGEDNVGWTTEKNITQIIRSLWSHRVNSVLDHALGSVSYNHLDTYVKSIIGLGTSDVLIVSQLDFEKYFGDGTEINTCELYGQTVGGWDYENQDVDIDDEIIDSTPNGVKTSFSGTLVNTPIEKNSLSVDYIISAVPYTGIDDGNGNITGTNIVSGTINYLTGVWSIIFSIPVDNGTNITSDYTYYTHTRVIIPRKTYVFLKSNPSDGIINHFKYDITNFPHKAYELKTEVLKKGEVRIGGSGIDEAIVTLKENYCKFITDYLWTKDNCQNSAGVDEIEITDDDVANLKIGQTIYYDGDGEFYKIIDIDIGSSPYTLQVDRNIVSAYSSKNIFVLTEDCYFENFTIDGSSVAGGTGGSRVGDAIELNYATECDYTKLRIENCNGTIDWNIKETNCINNLFLTDTILTKDTTDSIDLGLYKGDLIIFSDPAADITLTFSNMLISGRRLVIVNKDSVYKITLAGTITSVITPEKTILLFSDGTSLYDPISSLQSKTFTSNGTFIASTDKVLVTLWGGGGAGAGNSGYNGGGGGGGAGLYIYRKLIEVISGNSYNITIGNGGVGTHSGHGSPGEDSLFDTLLTASGGEGGKDESGPGGDGGAGGGSQGAIGGAGGAGGTGVGDDGENGNSGSSILYLLGGGGGGGGGEGTGPSSTIGGNGGNTLEYSGGIGDTDSDGGAGGGGAGPKGNGGNGGASGGNAGPNTGAGGGGGSSHNGGDGGSGGCIIEWVG